MNTLLNRYVIIALTFLVTVLSKAEGQIFPENRSELNFRLINFNIPVQDGVSEYEFEIWKYDIKNNGEVAEKSVYKKKEPKNSTITLLPYWSQVYTWKVTYYSNGKAIGSSDINRFATGGSPYIDTSLYRLRIITNKVSNETGYIFIDGLKALFSFDGSPIWYLPNIEDCQDQSNRVRDLKPTSNNTITYLTDKGAYEIDFRGNILWKAPDDGQVSGDTTEGYHHQFDRLSNGHYMIAGSNTTIRKIDGITDTSLYKNETDIIKENGVFYKKISCGTLIEYDSKGKVVWYWKASDHFTDADFFARKSPSGTVNSYTHMNCFYYDSTSQKIYIGFRDINRIVVINYPAGNVIAQYGENYTSDKSIIETSSFKAHHNNTITSKGELLLFNNNLNARQSKAEDLKETISSVVKFKITENGLIKNWEYLCDIDTLSIPFTFAGGSVEEITENQMLVSMGAVNRNFIVTNKKELIWNTLSERNDTEKKIWLPQSSYKAAFISNKKAMNYIYFNSK